jgi:hypothetical protein
MCTEFYIGSEKEIDLVNWDDQSPGFFTKQYNDKSSQYAQEVLGSKHVYFAGSFMGCSCGFYLIDEDIDNRLRDIAALISYLNTNLNGNILKLFPISWESFPENYPEKKMYLSTIIVEEFDFEEDVIYYIYP